MSDTDKTGEVAEVTYSRNGTTDTDVYTADRVLSAQVWDALSGDGGRAKVSLRNGFDKDGRPVRSVLYAQAYRVIRRPAGGGS